MDDGRHKETMLAVGSISVLSCSLKTMRLELEDGGFTL